MLLETFKNIENALLGSVYVITEDKDGKENPVMVFDTVEETLFRASSTVVNYPTEAGISVTDYKYDSPSVLSVRGIIARNSNIGKNFISVTLGKQLSQEKMREQLEYYKSGLYALNIQTKSGKYKGYTLEGYEIPENLDNYSLFEVTLNFKQIVSVFNEKPRQPSDKDTVRAGIVRVLGLS